MQTIELSEEAVLSAAGVLPESVPIVMLNLLRYREHADYGGRTDVAPCSGREAYHQRYVPAFNSVAVEGIRLVWVGAVLANLIGPDG